VKEQTKTERTYKKERNNRTKTERERERFLKRVKEHTPKKGRISNKVRERVRRYMKERQ
jgi:hypothetical protein